MSRARLATVLLAALTALTERGQGMLYLNVGHTGLDRAGFRYWLARADVRPVYLVHDLIPLSHPHYCRPGEDARHTARIETMLATGAGIITNSHATRDELIAWAHARGVVPPAIVAAWLGHDVPRDKSDAPPVGRPYFVILGTIEGRKNHALLLRIWQRFTAEYGDAIPTLVVIGQRGWKAEATFGLLDDAGERVIELNDCDDHVLARYLRYARALLFPSYAEGFGLPLIEALDVGTPVIASDLPVFRELAGESARYLHPDDQAGWSRAIRAAAESAPDLAARDAAAAAYRVPTYAEHFAQVDAWLDQLPAR